MYYLAITSLLGGHIYDQISGKILTRNGDTVSRTVGEDIAYQHEDGHSHSPQGQGQYARGGEG